MTNDTIQMLQTLFEPGDCFELRIFDVCRSGDRFPHIESGYFDYEHISSIPSLLGGLASYTGVYVTLNPVNPALLARANNRLVRAKRGLTTSDEDIITRRWLFIDIDPVRPAGISATDAEKAFALDKLIEVKDGLASMGFTEPLCVDSGNGFYLIYRIEGNPDISLVKQAMEALSVCSDDKVHIDTSVHNAARICRLAGTFNRKGEDMPDRPHRLSELLEVPERIEATPLAILEKLAGSSSEPEQRPSVPLSTGYSPSTIDDYNNQADITPLLEKHGWKLKSDTDQQYWWRPGKADGQHSATFNGDVFYVFSANAQPFEHGKGYSRFAVYSMLEHGGNNSVAVEVLETLGYGNLERGVDLTAFMDNLKGKEIVPAIAKETESKEVPIIPERLFNVPGFMNEQMDFCMKTAPYPNLRLAFCGSLTMQSFLSGRKVKEHGNIRGNIYVLGLASSGTGKDWPRKINSNIMMKIDAIDCLGSKFASGEGLEDVMSVNYNMLYQTDEIDSMLRSMKSPKDSRYEGVGSTLMIFYTSADSSMPLRTKAGMDKCRSIIYPHLTIFGTATPKNYYQALSERMMTNGFFSRMMVIDAGSRPLCEMAGDIDELPERVIETARFWHDKTRTIRNSGGNLSWENPRPQVVEYTGKAGELLFDFQRHSDVEHINAEANDEVTKAIWSRAAENARKLALLRGCSENHTEPVINEQTAKWAIEFVDYQIKRQLYMAETYATDNEFHAQCLKFMDKLRNTPGRTLQRGVLLKRMKIDKDSFNRIVATLEEQGDVKGIPTSRGYKYVFLNN